MGSENNSDENSKPKGNTARYSTTDARIKAAEERRKLLEEYKMKKLEMKRERSTSLQKKNSTVLAHPTKTVAVQTQSKESGLMMDNALSTEDQQERDWIAAQLPLAWTKLAQPITRSKLEECDPFLVIISKLHRKLKIEKCQWSKKLAAPVRLVKLLSISSDDAIRKAIFTAYTNFVGGSSKELLCRTTLYKSLTAGDSRAIPAGLSDSDSDFEMMPTLPIEDHNVSTAIELDNAGKKLEQEVAEITRRNAPLLRWTPPNRAKINHAVTAIKEAALHPKDPLRSPQTDIRHGMRKVLDLSNSDASAPLDKDKRPSGSAIKFAILTPSKKVKSLLQTEYVVSPVRRSTRLMEKDSTLPKSLVYDEIGDIPESVEFGYLPNNNVSTPSKRLNRSKTTKP